MCSISSAVVVSARWNGVVMRPAIWSGGRPVYCQTTPMTGIRMSGKMSVGVRSAANGPIIRRSSASTTKVYGRLRAIRTRAIINRAFLGRRELAPQKGQFVGLIYPKRYKKANIHHAPVIHFPVTGPPAHPAGEIRREGALSGGPDRVEELADFALEAVAAAGKRLRRRETLRGGKSGLAGAALHVGDVGRDLHGALSGLLHVAGNLLRRRALLFHRRGDGRGDFRQFLDRAA